MKHVHVYLCRSANVRSFGFDFRHRAPSSHRGVLANATPRRFPFRLVAHRVSKDEARAMHPMLRICIDAIQASKLSSGSPAFHLARTHAKSTAVATVVDRLVGEIPLRVEGRVMRRTFQDRVRPGTDLSKAARGCRVRTPRGCSFGGDVRIFATVDVYMHARGTNHSPFFWQSAMGAAR
jgi:hypothetical protein